MKRVLEAVTRPPIPRYQIAFHIQSDGIVRKHMPAALTNTPRAVRMVAASTALQISTTTMTWPWPRPTFSNLAPPLSFIRVQHQPYPTCQHGMLQPDIPNRAGFSPASTSRFSNNQVLVKRQHGRGLLEELGHVRDLKPRRCLITTWHFRVSRCGGG